MTFEKGNRFWEARSSSGRRPIFDCPEKLWAACTEYFEWVEDNPLMASEPVKFQGQATLAEVPKMRAMTLDGLCIFLDIARQTWENYCKRDDFLEVTTRVGEIIRTQKFTGAAADLLNPNIIARDLGLAERREHTGKVELDDTARAARLEALLKKAEQRRANDKSGQNSPDSAE